MVLKQTVGSTQSLSSKLQAALLHSSLHSLFPTKFNGQPSEQSYPSTGMVPGQSLKSNEHLKKLHS